MVFPGWYSRRTELSTSDLTYAPLPTDLDFYRLQAQGRAKRSNRDSPFGLLDLPRNYRYSEALK